MIWLTLPRRASLLCAANPPSKSVISFQSTQSVEELTNAGIKMAEINKLKEANLATVGAVLATPTKARYKLLKFSATGC